MQVDFTIEIMDIAVYFVAVLYAGGVLILADIARRRFDKSTEFTRRIVHLFAGLAIWTVPYFPHSWFATFVALTFVVMLGLSNTDRFSRFFAAMARPEDLEHGSVRGPFWYAVSITGLTALFTFTGNEMLYFLPAAGIHIMMFGDGMAAPFGMKYGTDSSRNIFGSNRSAHGSGALFVFGFIGALLAIWFFGVFNYGVFVVSGEVQWLLITFVAFVGALSAMLIELVSPKGTDNITVPFLSTIVMFALVFGLNLMPVAI
ncbi:MAG: diacylglycerol/polyprenol kinase family protein [Candidatus Thorarchaeota archaeon]